MYVNSIIGHQFPSFEIKSKEQRFCRKAAMDFLCVFKTGHSLKLSFADYRAFRENRFLDRF